MEEFKHYTVMKNEAVDALECKNGLVYVDCTLGGGGHSELILQRISPDGRLIAFDIDDDAIRAASERLKNYKNVTIVKESYTNIKKVLQNLGIEKITGGVLFDLGASYHQLTKAERGFSFMKDAPLDMRFDTNSDFTAYDVVNFYSEKDLLRILYDYGEEQNAKNIVKNILLARVQKPIETTFELKDIIEKSFPKKVVYGKGGVSKQTFQAIRIEVNQELEGLKTCIESLIKFLKPGGRFAIISFHSLEDRIVKNAFKDACTGCICPPKTPVCICGHHAVAKAITRKPIIASQEELNYNSRASSAKLRIIEKL